MRINRKLRWALVLSGGGAKGLAHIGVIKALLDKGYPEPSLIAGTSMGAIVGGLYASGMAVPELARFTLEEFDITQYLDSFVFKLNGPVGKFLQAGQLIGTLAGKPGMDSGNQVRALIEKLTGNKNIEETRIPFRCNAVDLVSGEEVVFRSGNLARAIRASMSFPGFFEPVKEGEMFLVDGGLGDNMPVRIAAEEGFKRILAVKVGAFKTLPAHNFDTSPKILYRSLETALRLLHSRAGTDHPALVITAVHDSATPLSFDKKHELIALGEQAVRENEENLAAFFGSGLGAFLARRRGWKSGAADYPRREI
ncbi:MAG: patatin-like phospholipase family protein [Spirochaetaceae bacterium]|jgi:NTE family protein|nr:patatin-like phospholipase family protein [Spirochaetaceae bacterium]